MTSFIFLCTMMLSATQLEAFTPLALQTKRLYANPLYVVEVEQEIQPENLKEPESIQVPLKFIGPYPTMGLRFPNLATKNQKAQNKTGISLDFVLDTAANTNTINAQVASELELEVVGEALPGLSSAGAMQGGQTYMLGDSQLEGIQMKEEMGEDGIFMQNLTASALPIASPASAGLLSLPFFYCFEGGVEFSWGSSALKDGMPDPASITFYGDEETAVTKALPGMTRVLIDPIPVTQLPSVMLNINGMKVPALLDTGSPITVLNSEAARQAGIATIQLPPDGEEKSNNPFAAFANRFKNAQAAAKAAANGDLLTIAGSDGKPTNLLKSTSTFDLSLSGDSEDVSFGSGHIYVGDIPGLAALNGIGVDSPPAAVLGMDVLRKRPRMFLRARDQEVYF
ncbi:unnamed protein product [Cylindrotheca closterium]|uniref:Peptidase A2 domain-containing protein n=1 Tax=Cylindrotheca closterium TaxID=2856 RepID=A0AAD2CPX2_9STRA|nr:unnamed protein product [Cylindrotheca closterium]